MPYKSIDSFNLDEPCLVRFAHAIRNKNTIYYVLSYRKWAKGKGYWQSAQLMLDEYESLDDKGRLKHFDRLKEYLESKGTGSNDRRNTWFAVSRFYRFEHHSHLPDLEKEEKDELFKASEADAQRALHDAPLMLEEIRRIALDMRMPHRAAFIVMFQAALGRAEFELFNKQSWESIKGDLDKPGPAQVRLYRKKTTRSEVADYYTFLGEDAKNQIKEWLKVRPDSDLPHLFITYRKNDRQWVPLSARMVAETLTETAKRLALIHPGKLGPATRYHIHPHEVRDLVKSLCQLNGVREVASKLFLGHSIDKLGYDKSPKYDVEFFRREYLKVEPLLDVISNPAMTGQNVKERVVAAFNEQYLQMAGYNTEELAELGDLSKLTPERLQNLVRAKQMQALGLNGKSRQKVVKQTELRNYIEQGWEFVTTLNGHEAIIKLPSEHT